MKTAVVIGASENPERYSNRAVKMLQSHEIPVVAIGIREGEINGLKIQKGQPAIPNVHTVTLYVGPKNQASYKDYILSLDPVRIIFNPGAENRSFAEEAAAQGIEVVEGCTLTMLTVGTY